MRNTIWDSRSLLLVFIVAVLIVPGAAAAQEDPESTQDPESAAQEEEGNMSSPEGEAEIPAVQTEEGEELWFVKLESSPTADGTSEAKIKEEQQAFRDEAKQAGIKFKEHYAFDKLWNGLSVEVDESHVSALSQLGGVRALYPVQSVSVPVPEVEEPEGENLTLDTALAMTGADVAQNDLGYKGEGVKVGIIDSGIDLDHPDLGGNPDQEDNFPTTRVNQGYDFVGNAFSGVNTPNPDQDPDDCGGHGTHVAGIVGANGEVTGVAPKVKFGAYKIFGCNGSTRSDLLIAAMEQALADGMDVVNMSLGTPLAWPQYPTAEAADRLVNKGVSVVAAIGNDSNLGLYAASAPAIGDKVIGVAAFEKNGLIRSTSSYGLTPDLRLKPDLGAPGGSIRSTYPLEGGTAAGTAANTTKYAVLSGTSMASPHVAGGVALLLEAKSNVSSQVVRDILQNSADPKPWSGNNPNGFLDNVHRQGGGMIDIDDAIKATTDVEGVNQATTKIEPGKLSLGESESGVATNALTIKNSGSSDVTYNLTNEAALATTGTRTPSFFNRPATATFSIEGMLDTNVTSVTVPAGGTATVNATISAPATLANQGQYGGYIKLSPEGGGQTYRVPYAGFKGDYQSIQALTSTPNNTYPRLVNQTGQQQATYTLVNGDIPYIRVHLEHPVRRVKMEVFDAASGESWPKLLDTEYASRNSSSTSFFAFSWDGMAQNNGGKRRPVPNGQYVIRLSVEKALGDDKNPADLETWTSPPFTIKRP